jgi:uncharacterized membrane protein YdbT with pleckstrin-like domain
MATYVEQALTSGERVIYSAKLSLWSQAHLLILGVLSLPIMGLGFLFLLNIAIKYFTTELAVTNKRVVAKAGLIRRTTIEINIGKVESIQVQQGIFGRIFNFGSIIVAGAGNPQGAFAGISMPLEFRRAFLETQEQNSPPHGVSVRDHSAERAQAA